METIYQLFDATVVLCQASIDQENVVVPLAGIRLTIYRMKLDRLVERFSYPQSEATRIAERLTGAAARSITCSI